TIVLAEVPTGAVADSIGRKLSLLIGNGLLVLAAVWFGLAGSFGGTVAAHILWGIAISFDSGAMIAMFYESLQQIGREAEYVRLRSRMAVLRVAAAALGSILGGLLGSVDLRLPFIGYALLIAVSFSLTLALKDPPPDIEDGTGERIRYREALQVTTRTLRRKPVLRTIILYAAVVPVGSFLVAVLIIQPYAVEAGIAIGLLGVISFGYQLGRMLGSAASERLLGWLGLARLLCIAPPAIAAGMLALALLPPWWGIALSFGVGFMYMVLQPGIEKEILNHIPASVRATLLSVLQLIARAAISIFELVSGWLSDLWGLRVMLAVIAGIILVVLWLVLVRWQRLESGRVGNIQPQIAD
ncbi:MAG: MFS transporter, partial [Anaerolineales bacterium]